jgi:hypothetical protein
MATGLFALNKKYEKSSTYSSTASTHNTQLQLLPVFARGICIRYALLMTVKFNLRPNCSAYQAADAHRLLLQEKQ